MNDTELVTKLEALWQSLKKDAARSRDKSHWYRARGDEPYAEFHFGQCIAYEFTAQELYHILHPWKPGE